MSNAVSMQKEIDELKANALKLQVDCQARVSAAERKSNFYLERAHRRQGEAGKSSFRSRSQGC